MRTRLTLFAWLALQICFLLWFLMIAPEPQGSIQVGLRRLKEEVPAQAVTVQTRTDGNMELKTAGDFFYAAGRALQTIDRATIGFTMVSIVITAFLLITLKRNKIEPVQ